MFRVFHCIYISVSNVTYQADSVLHLKQTQPISDTDNLSLKYVFPLKYINNPIKIKPAP